MNTKPKIAWLLNLEEQTGHLIPCPHQGISTLLRSKLEKAGYTIKMSNDAGGLGEFDVLISGDIDAKRIEQMAAYPRERCFLIATEPPTVIPEFHSPITKQRFGKIFTLLQRYIDNQTYFKIHHLILQKNPVSQKEEIPFDQKNFCCMIQGNKMAHPLPGELYTERKSLALHFTHITSSQPGEFDLYGPWWNGVGSWRGIANTNKEVLKYYKFTICYENTCDEPGYITERIFHSIISRNIPIYLGAPDILDYIPKDCFIDARDFGGKGHESQKRIWDFMKNMDKDTYNKYIQAGENYINNNPKYKLFSVENVVNTIMEQVNKLPEQKNYYSTLS